jgi:N-formylglutamate deformylase
MSQLILHIPHSSTIIPFLDGYVPDQITLDEEILKLTDWYTDDLFHSEDDIIIKANFSRIFCDVERFEDDSLEVMASKGMGVLYEKLDNGDPLRNVTSILREKILCEFYRPHHMRFTEAVRNQLDKYSSALILDCHSFPDIPMKRDLDQTLKRPDFNIGTDAFHTPPNLIEVSVDFFDSLGYTLGINLPYSGTIVPMNFYQKDNKVKSIMLEINRRLYLTENSNEKSVNYRAIKQVVKDFMALIKNEQT